MNWGNVKATKLDFSAKGLVLPKSPKWGGFRNQSCKNAQAAVRFVDFGKAQVRESWRARAQRWPIGAACVGPRGSARQGVQGIVAKAALVFGGVPRYHGMQLVLG